MLNLKNLGIIMTIALGFSSISMMPNAYALGGRGADTYFGFSAPDTSGGRQINITAKTKWVNVTSGETIRFNVDGKVFTWHFESLNQQPFDLSKIAPEGMHLDGIRVYMAADPSMGG